MKILTNSSVNRYIPYQLRKHIQKFISRHLYFEGPFDVRLFGEKKFRMAAHKYVLENEVFYYGLENGHEKKAMRVWIEFCELFNPKYVADIGANTGIYGLVAKALDSNCSVAFFEPLESAHKIISENLSLNDFDAVNLNLALSNYDGEGEFFLNEGSDFHYSITLNEYADLAIQGTHDSNINYTTLKSKVSRFSTLVQDKLVHIPNLVKIDVETHEPEVLEGFGLNLELVDAFLIEVLNDEAANKLNKLFQNMNFRIFNLNDETFEVFEYDYFRYTGNYNYFVLKPNLVAEMKTLKN